MTDERKKKPTKIRIADVSRAARRLQEAIDGDRIISDTSAPALREFALGFESQYEEQQRRAGSQSKKKQGIWSETLRVLINDPEMKAEEIWNHLRDVGDIGAWDIWADDKKVTQNDHFTGKDASVMFSTWRSHYFYPAKKEARAKKTTNS